MWKVGAGRPGSRRERAASWEPGGLAHAGRGLEAGSRAAWLTQGEGRKLGAGRPGSRRERAGSWEPGGLAHAGRGQVKADAQVFNSKSRVNGVVCWRGNREGRLQVRSHVLCLWKSQVRHQQAVEETVWRVEKRQLEG